MEGTLTGTTTPGQSRSGSDGNEGISNILQSSMTGGSSDDEPAVVTRTHVGGGLISLQRCSRLVFSILSMRVGGVIVCVGCVRSSYRYACMGFCV